MTASATLPISAVTRSALTVSGPWAPVFAAVLDDTEPPVDLELLGR